MFTNDGRLALGTAEAGLKTATIAPPHHPLLGMTAYGAKRMLVE